MIRKRNGLDGQGRSHWKVSANCAALAWNWIYVSTDRIPAMMSVDEQAQFCDQC
jgi:hypothetical protein